MLKTLRAQELSLAICEDRLDSVLWLNGSTKFFLQRVPYYFIDKLVDCSKRLGVTSLLDVRLHDLVVTEAFADYPIDLDFLRVYFGFILDSLLKGATSKTLHPYLLRNSLNACSGSPTRMDLAVTYRCNNRCYFCYADCPRDTDELSTGQWFSLIDSFRDLNIPCVNFTGGEPTVRKDLVDLVARASDFTTGLTTNGRLLTKALCRDLKGAGLDYAQVTLHSLEGPHDFTCGHKGAWRETVRGIEASLAAGINTVTNCTLMRNTYLEVVEYLEFLYTLGVRQACFNGLLVSGKGKDYERDGLRLNYEETAGALRAALVTAKTLPGMKIEWLTPTCYKRLNPRLLGLGDKCCSACSFNVTVEPWGRVIPCQSWLHEDCGNILTDSWESIWSSSLASRARDTHVRGECYSCDFSSSCRGACPLDLSWLDDSAVAVKVPTVV